MADQFADDTDRRLSSLAGLEDAGIVQSFHFNPFTGLVGVVYTPNWVRILESDMTILVHADFGAAMLADDPVAMRSFVEREGSRLAVERSTGLTQSSPRRSRRPGQ
jgi:hypothetical protein